MKHLYTIVFFITSLYTGNGQEPLYGDNTLKYFPSHPLIEKQEYIRGNADSIVWINMKEDGTETLDSYELIKRSVDGWIDTISYFTQTAPNFVQNTSVMIVEYATDNKPVSFWNERSGLLEYTYDEKGRITTNPRTKNTIYTYRYLDDQILYTDSGYFHTTITSGIPYADGSTGSDTITTEYVFDDQNRLIRVGDTHYSYLENGDVMATIFYKSPSGKQVSHYNKNGLYLHYFSYSGSPEYGWTLLGHQRFEYYTKGSPVSTEPVIVDHMPVVYGIEGAVRLKADTEQIVCIYTVNGQRIRKIKMQPGQTEPLPPGLYIITTESHSHKVLVR